MVALTIGIVSDKDFDGVYFTLQALRLYHDLDDTELLVVDRSGCLDTQDFVEAWAKGRYVHATEAVGAASSWDMAFHEARGDAVLCCDAHILFVPGAIARLKHYFREHPDCIDLLQGPLVHDDLQGIFTHLDPVWRGQMWGIWATDPRGEDPDGEPFEIPMQGLGVFSCRKDIWPGFNPRFRGFGGDEGYIHEKFRRAGGECLCLPWLRWVHRTVRPAGAPNPSYLEERLRNYVTGHAELGLDTEPVLQHFSEQLPKDRVAAVAAEALWGDSAATPSGRSAPVYTSQASKPPLVSCICATYNRPPNHQHLLEESIESFLRQTYPNKELIVLNDCPAQELVCDAPGVRVVSVPERFPSLGDKWNAGVALARGDLIAPWADDDINLPWRLSLSVELLGDADYFNPRCYWFLDRNGLHFDHPVGYAHGASMFTRAGFESVGGYPSISLGEDAVMDGALSKLERVADPHRGHRELTRREWFYIYRWGVNPVHVSGRAYEDFYREIGLLPVEAGRFCLTPQWRGNYEADTRRLLDV